ncbi:hypothetical protein HMPREF9318_01127 [Streptococcus urinalis FB127-CNA-2]|uniref:Primosomal protein DnaI n=1 Tax=Streptococcus urinalis 2285-97 TaxID=764291 RepID=G5KHS0_9STRE|nr:primosomal protein DnaI [Streptococcus urinalis]EHJ56629.1 primosomal protein DnaI [Streptococcus urinalis 2285-97]EKS21173.1 hypothetical protein HMPREF9318_01127 [Streptococcus urinalis FB127-CNA-2]VEF31182.1 primosomal protein [Streptococcus urinalis]
MKKIGETISRMSHNQGKRQDIIEAILADKEVSDFITSHHLTTEEIELSLSKFNQFLSERQKWKEGSSSYIAKGYQPILAMNEGYADVTYLETKALKEAQAKKAIENRINLVSLPKSYKSISFEDIDLNDERREAVFDRLIDFVVDYPKTTKGLYIYGDMGIGKSFLMAAMAHELSEKKGISTTLLHFPSFVIDVKNAISSGSVKEEIDNIKDVPVLILDDIGAEQATSWVRDEVLQVILQHRMLEELPTFFTSNYNFTDLEKKWATIKGNDETWQSRRVMERVRYLADEIHLEGVNRR